MKKFICVLLCFCLLLIFSSCSGSMLEDKNEENLAKYIGNYEAKKEEISLTVFDISATGDVFFEIGLIDAWVITGTGRIKDSSITFSIGAEGNKNSGTMILNDGEIELEIIQTQRNFEKNIGKYVLNKKGDVNKTNTYCDKKLNLNNHSVFESFVNEFFSDRDSKWELLGTTLGEFGILSWGDSGFNSDLYKLSNGLDNRYYVVYLANAMTGDKYGVSEIVEGTLTPFLYIRGSTVNSKKESSSIQQDQTFGKSEMCVWCHKNPRSKTNIFSAYCDSCKCIDFECSDKKTIGSSYCYDHSCLICDARVCDGSQYCTSHKCAVSDCNKKKEKNSVFCRYH